MSKRRRKMTEEVKEAVKEEVKEVSPEEVTEISPEEAEVSPEEAEVSPEGANCEEKKAMSPFIGDNDNVVCKIHYYLKDDGSGFIVEGVDEEFQQDLAKDFFEVTFRVPTQKDSNLIRTKMTSNSGETELGIYSAFANLEYVRMLVLIKDWTLPKLCSEDNIEELHPSFVKGIVNSLRDKIGMDGIV